MKPLSLALFGAILLTTCQDTAQITQPEAGGAPPSRVSLLKAASGPFAYVTNVSDNTVSVIDLSTNTVVGSPIPVGSRPTGIAMMPDGSTAFVVNNGSGDVSVIDLSTNTVVGSPIPVGSGPIRIAISPDGSIAYVTNVSSDNVSVIDLNTKMVVGLPIAVGDAPIGIAFAPDGTTAYVANAASSSVSVIDVATSTVVGPPILDGLQPQYLAITPDGTTAYVANTGASAPGDVSAIDLATRTPVARIPVGDRAAATAITLDGTTVYVTNLITDDVFVIDVATNAVVGSPIPVGEWPVDMAITSDGTTAYVVNRDANSVSVIDLNTNTVVGLPIPVGNTPFGIAITPVVLNEPPDCSGAAIADQSADANCGATISGADVTGVTDPDGDPFTITVSPTTLSLGANIVTVTDDDGNGGICNTDITVSVVDDTPPAITTISVPVNPIQVNTSITSFSATFTDLCDADNHSATWDFGDPNDPGQSAGTVDQVGNSVGGSHTYTAAGVYTVTLTVTDQNGVAGSNSAQTTAIDLVVIYDPSGGFVTGGGWIDSPAGAYIADPSLTGKANFGLVSKYKKGATIPTGNTKFQFKAGNLDFHSSSYDFLVITMGGTNAQYKGSGTVNGGLAPTGNEFKFMIWARDESPDTFRIKIWYDDGGVLVYDNGFDQPISGGSIVIHTK